ncbi:GAD-like domain-containing protein [Xenorhabdus taiwanensis]|uniref:GAD-like domain-containing protein n=1 Tax=Xenorhabdus taiwanensis TaxID=3085177 RepID=A0ABM8JTJ4_9GAMM|nr:GAD-like domain-containing protein [Xenorhabdus sp. TCT-1]
MRDHYFNEFIDEFGEATQNIPVPGEAIEKWKGRLPDRLLHYWKTEGWNSYQNGLFSLVNPDVYESIVDMWLEDTPFESMDAYHVIARSGFGDLCLCGEKTGTNLKISCAFNTIYYNKGNFYDKNKESHDLDISAFLSSKSPDSFDIEDDDDIWLFFRAVEKYGPLNENQIFGFEPAIFLGGDVDLENIRKLDLYIHLDILGQFSKPIIEEV